MKTQKSFRWWFYTRIGFHTYFAFILTGINTLTITYFLAIEKAPFLENLFPTFSVYVLYFIGIGLPLVAFVGYVHFRKIPGFKTESEVRVENNPYVYKLPPGFAKNVNWPYHLLQSKILMKIAQNEKVSEEEKNELAMLQEKMEHLIKGGFVGVKKGQRSFGDIEEEED